MIYNNFTNQLFTLKYSLINYNNLQCFTIFVSTMFQLNKK